MNKPLTREPTAAETKEAQDVALAMTDALGLASSVPIGLGALSMLTMQTFFHAVKAEYVLGAWDTYAADIRQQLEAEIRRAHN